jgi:hypothetical protein
MVKKQIFRKIYRISQPAAPMAPSHQGPSIYTFLGSPDPEDWAIAQVVGIYTFLGSPDPEDWAIAQVVGIPGAEPTAREFESRTELPCFTAGFILGFSGGPSDRAGAHAQQ